tara:strand:+ start:10415 stop:11524 length:1110 start_codon:yes stop_codon:yes gene_type:complete
LKEKMIKFLDLHDQYMSIKHEVDEAISNVITNTSFIGGEQLTSFEKEFADFQNSNFCLGVGNGTDALEIALEALNLPANSEIIVPANSFIASSEAVTRTGHKVVFCDVDKDDYTIDTDDVENKITENTSAIIAVHLYGHPCNMDVLQNISKKFNLRIIEDCAQAHGAEYKDKRVGSLGDVGCFSFYPGKNLGAYGDGGAITTNSEDIFLKCKKIANHGRISKYDHEFEGRNSRLDGLQASILRVKLRHLESWTERRISIAKMYKERISQNTNLVLPIERDWARQVYHLFVVRCKDRDKFMETLRKDGIQTGIHYPIALPSLEAYKNLNQAHTCPSATSIDKNLVSLPIGEHLTDEDVSYVIERVLRYFQ